MTLHKLVPQAEVHRHTFAFVARTPNACPYPARKRGRLALGIRCNAADHVSVLCANVQSSNLISQALHIGCLSPVRRLWAELSCANNPEDCVCVLRLRVRTLHSGQPQCDRDFECDTEPHQTEERGAQF